MSLYFEIEGFFKDDHSPICAVVKEYDDVTDDDDDAIFFYGLSETDIQEAIRLARNTVHDFVITDYRVLPCYRDEG